uniref:Astacin domain-containing protein n=1 Tax=Parastrongyloides trichosuri TaxID=131310 RepID=A0A0N4ZJ51_PARTI
MRLKKKYCYYLSILISIFTTHIFCENVTAVGPKEEVRSKNVTINYYYENGLNETQIKKAIERIENHTCLMFNKSNSPLSIDEGINILANPECSLISNVDEKYSNQFLVDQFPCLNNSGRFEKIIAEELGALNKTSRRLLKIYLKGLTDRINKSLSEDYFKGNFSSLQNFSNIVGEKYKLDFYEYKLINQMYCDKCKSSEVVCENYGYINPKNCSECICPYGFSGVNCSSLDLSSESSCVNSSTLTANETKLKIGDEGKKRCVYKIKSKDGRNISIRDAYINTNKSPYPEIMNICPENMAFEVKLINDKGRMGTCSCGNYSGLTFSSNSSQILLIYNGIEESNKFELKFYETGTTTASPLTTKANQSQKVK